MSGQVAVASCGFQLLELEGVLSGNHRKPAWLMEFEHEIDDVPHSCL